MEPLGSIVLKGDSPRLEQKAGSHEERILGQDSSFGTLLGLQIAQVASTLDPNSGCYNCCSYYSRPYPVGPSTQCLRFLAPKTIPVIVYATRDLKYWILGPSGLVTCWKLCRKAGARVSAAHMGRFRVVSVCVCVTFGDMQCVFPGLLAKMGPT